jgi:hypothetical protein
MNKHQQLELTINREQLGYEKKRHQIVHWLQHIMPGILQKQIPVTSIIYLKATRQAASFCLS